MRPVGQPVDQRLTQPRVGEDLPPLGERQVGGDDDRGPLGAIGDHLEQQLGADLGERHVAELVDADQLDALPASERPAQGVGGAGLDQLVDQGGRGGEAHPAALLAGGDAQPRGQMGLAGAGFADQQHRLGTGDVAAGGEIGDARRRHRRLGEVELLQGLQPWQPGLLDPPQHGLALTLLDLGAEQGVEVADMAVAFARRRLGQALVLRRDRRRLERAAVLPDDLVVQVDRGAARRGHGPTSRPVSSRS